MKRRYRYRIIPGERARRMMARTFGCCRVVHNDYLRLQDQLLADQVAFATPTVWEGEVVGRFALLHPSTTIEMVEAVLDAVR